MSKHVSYNKLSKKAKRQFDAKSRRTFDAFGCFSPITKVIMDKKKEKRRRVCREKQLFKPLPPLTF